MTSLRSYALFGAGGGLFFGILASMDAQFASTRPLVLGTAGASGAILGAVRYATRAWDARGPAGNLLRWISGLGLAGVILGGIAGLLGAISLAEVPAAIGFSLLAGWGFGLKGQQRTLLGGDGYRERTAREIIMLWLVILATIAVAGSLLALSWFLTE